MAFEKSINTLSVYGLFSNLQIFDQQDEQLHGYLNGQLEKQIV